MGRKLAVALAAVLVAAVVIGGFVGVLAFAGARVAGVGAPSSTATEEPSLYIPDEALSTKRPEEPAASSTPTPSSAPSAGPAPAQADQDRKKRDEPRREPRPKPRIVLRASPTSGSTYQRIYLRGSYAGGNGSTLTVQRFEGGWSAFPVTASVSGGTFETWVESGQEGANRFRVVDRSSGRASNPVTVTLR